MDINIRIAKETEYIPFELEDPQFNFGVSHHSTGLGKLKVYDKSASVEYNVPVEDLTKPMAEWRIEQR